MTDLEKLADEIWIDLLKQHHGRILSNEESVLLLQRHIHSIEQRTARRCAEICNSKINNLSVNYTRGVLDCRIGIEKEFGL